MKLLNATYNTYAKTHIEIDVLFRRRTTETTDNLLIFVNINNRTTAEYLSEYNVPFFSDMIIIDLKEKSDSDYNPVSVFFTKIEDSDIYGDATAVEMIALPALSLFLSTLDSMIYDTETPEELNDVLDPYSEFFVE
jgi:hypothetical protein